MESLRGELSALYKKQFMKLDAAESAGKDTSRMRISLLENYVKDLQEQNEMLIGMVQDVTVTRDDYKCQMEARNEQIDRLKSSLRQLECEVDECRNAKTQIACELNNVTTELNKYLHRAEDAEHENRMMGETLVEQEKQLTRVTIAADTLAENADGAHEELECLRDKLRNALKELEELCSCNKELESVVGELKDELEHYKDTLVEAEAENQKKKRHIDGLEKTLAKQGEELDACADQLQRMAHDLEATQVQLCQTQADLRSSEACAAKLKADLEQAETDFRECEMDRDILDQKFTAYRNTHCYSNDQVCAKDEELKAQNQTITEVNCDREEKDKLLADMNCELQAQTNEVEDARQSLRLLGNELEQLRVQNADLLERITEIQEDRRRTLHDAELNYSQAQAEIRETRRQIDLLEDELVAKDEDLKNCCNEVRAKDDELAQLRTERRHTTTEFGKIQTDIQDQERELAQVVMDREKLKTDLAEACNMYNALAKRAERIEDELETQKCSFNQVEKENRELTAAIDSFSCDKNFLLQKVNKLENDLACSVKEATGLASQLSEEQQTANLALAKLKQLEEEIKKWEDCVKKYQNKLREYDKYSQCLQDQLQKLTTHATLDDQRANLEIRHMKNELGREQSTKQRLEFDSANKDYMISKMRPNPRPV